MARTRPEPNETGDKPLVPPEEEIQRFSVDDVPPEDAGWQSFRKTSITRMVRIDGPFVVETSEGELRCEDGWLAMDARGYPYPIAADEQSQIYEEVIEIQVPNEPRWERTPGRCVACEGWAPSDDALLCAMCEAQGVDAHKVMAIKAGTHPAYLPTSPHGLTVADLHFDGTWYHLPDGSKAKPISVEQALQNWKENNVYQVGTEAIAEPVT